MALVDKRTSNKNNVVKITPEKEAATVFDRLHPKYEFPFLSLFGKVYNIENVMLFLNRVKFPVSKLSEKLTEQELKKITKGKIKHVPNYWFLVELVTTDRILADKELVKELLSIENIKDKKFIIFNEIKSGIITKLEPDQKLIKYAKQLKVITMVLQEVAKELGVTPDNVEELSKDEYKKFKNTVKERIFKDIEGRVDGKIAEGVSDLSNEQLLKEYLR